MEDPDDADGALDTARHPYPHQLAGRVAVAILHRDDPLDPAALIDLSRNVAKHPLTERREQADAGDPLE